MFEKPAKTSVPIDPLIAGRWSGRALDPDKSVTRDKIIAMLEAARWAPSCYNDQPWRFIVWDRGTEEESWQKAFECLAEGNQSWVGNAQVLIAAIAGSRFSRNDKPNRWGQYDTGAAALNLFLQATSLGLMAHEMGGFNVDRLRETFGIPDEYTPMAMIAVGYQADPETLADQMKAMELADGERAPLEEHFFEGTWGNGISPG